jgi:hypothetical protein
MRDQAMATGKSMLQIMVESVRWMDDQIQGLIDRLAEVSGAESVQLRAISHQMAARAAPFFHPQLADIKHDHRSVDGKTIRPVIEITGYPGTKEIAPPTPALPPTDTKH